MIDLECDDMNFPLFGCVCFYKYSFSLYRYRYNQDKRLLIHEQKKKANEKENLPGNSDLQVTEQLLSP